MTRRVNLPSISVRAVGVEDSTSTVVDLDALNAAGSTAAVLHRRILRRKASQLWRINTSASWKPSFTELPLVWIFANGRDDA